jgi:TolB protein
MTTTTRLASLLAAGLLSAGLAGCSGDPGKPTADARPGGQASAQAGRGPAETPPAAAPAAGETSPAPAPAAGEAPRATTPAAGGTPTATAPAAEEEAGRETALADVVQLTSGFSRAGEAYFSHDANWIIFQATPPGETHYAMFVAKLEREGDRITGAGEPRRISPPGTRNTCGYFAPGGESLIYASTEGKDKGDDGSRAGYQREGGNYRWEFPDGMEIFRVDGWAERLHTPQALPPDDAAGAGRPVPETPAPVELTKQPITDNDAYDAECALSPDGKWIVFCSRRDGDSDLYVMKSDGTGAVRLTDQKGYDGGPFFSPDGKRIVYRSDRAGNNLLQVYVADLATDPDGNVTGLANERQLTDEHINWGPYFHPDGRHIVYTTSVHGHANYEVYAMRDDGSHKTRITHKAGFDGLPVFSPDGKHLMWSSKRAADQTVQVFVAKFTPPDGW